MAPALLFLRKLRLLEPRRDAVDVERADDDEDHSIPRRGQVERPSRRVGEELVARVDDVRADAAEEEVWDG